MGDFMGDGMKDVPLPHEHAIPVAPPMEVK
jgi:hypothetical protein